MIPAVKICASSPHKVKTLSLSAKGSRTVADLENFSMIDPSRFDGYIGELGSVYVTPSKKFAGAGTMLVRTYAQELQKAGYKQMVASAYYKNDSPDFFWQGWGATVMGQCVYSKRLH